MQAGGLEWAYRRSEPAAAKAGDGGGESKKKLDVLMLHGLGSSSYAYRNALAMLGGDGYDAYAPDWPGHGGSAKPLASAGGFKYTADELLAALDAFVDASGIKKPYALVVHGYVLGQLGLLHALRHADDVERLLILNTPLARSSKLRPELAAYKSPLPFMRPGSVSFFFVFVSLFDFVCFSSFAAPNAHRNPTNQP